MEVLYLFPSKLDVFSETINIINKLKPYISCHETSQNKTTGGETIKLKQHVIKFNIYISHIKVSSF